MAAAGQGETLESGARRLAGELAAFPVIGRPIQGGLDIFDKLRPLFGEMKAKGTAQAAIDKAVEAKPDIPRPSLRDRGFEFDQVSGKVRPMSLADQDRQAKAPPLPTLKDQGYDYDPVSRQLIRPATNAAGNALANTANAANAAKTAANAAGTAARAAPAAAQAAGTAAPAAGAATGAAGVLIAALGPIAAVAGATAIALKIAADAAQAFADRLNRRAQELEAFSPALARARARNEVENVRANLRAGREFGGDFAQFTKAQGQINRDLQRIGDVFQVAILNEMMPLIRRTADAVEFLAKNKGFVQIGAQATIAGLSPPLAALLGVLGVINGNAKITAEEAKKLAAQALEGDALNVIEWFNNWPDLDIEKDADHDRGARRHAARFGAAGQRHFRVELP